MTKQFTHIEKAMQIPGMMWPTELYSLAELFKNSSHHVEVGTYCGKSLYATASKMRPGSLITVVDDISMSNLAPSRVWISTVLDATTLAIFQNFQVNVEVIVKQSEAAVQHIKSYASIFIDADHSQESVCRDVLTWWDKLMNNGIMVGHDYTDDYMSVKNAVNIIFHDQFTVIPGTRFWMVKKIPEVNELVQAYRRIV